MNKNWSIAIAGVLVLSSLAGCASSSAGPNQGGTHAQNAAHQKPAQMRNSLAHSPSAYTQSTNANHYRNGYTVNGFDQNMAERLTKVADDVPGVDRATVVVSGQDAVIGVRIRENLAPEQGKVIEQKVHSAARAVSPSMNIRVTSEPTMFARIRGINDKIYNEAQNRTHNVSQVPHSIAQNMSSTANDFGVLLRDLGRTVTNPFR